MSYVFKQIDSSYKTSTPFYAHKRWTLNNINEDLDTSDSISLGEPSMSILYGRYTQSQWIGPAYEDVTRNDEFVRNVWNSVNTLYYRNFQNKPFEYYKYGSIGVETRDISETVQVFSIPQKIIGEKIKPGSFKLTQGGYTFFDDGNGNILGYDAVPNTTVFNSSSQDLYYCSYFFYDSFKYANTRSSFKVKSHGNLRSSVEWNLDSGSGICAPVHGPNYLTGNVVNVGVDNSGCPASNWFLDFSYNSSVTGSSYMRTYHAEELNFDTKDSFTISMWIKTATPLGTVALISKSGRRRVVRRPMNPQVSGNTINYNSYISDEIVGGSYPFYIELTGTAVTFSISDGATKSQATATITPNSWQLITCRKNSTTMQIFVNTTAGTAAVCGCHGSTKNDADIFIGTRGEKITSDPISINGSDRPVAGTSQYDGQLGPVHIFNKYLSNTEISNLYNDYYNNHYGNILYKQGLIVWTNHQGTNGSSLFRGVNCTFSAMQFRSTRQITTNEFICVTGPGELNMTTNPSVLIRSTAGCNPNLGGETFEGPNEQGECYSFVTGSNFSPYITGIGLYNDRGDLLVVGKLATPIKKPTNCDLVIVVKWDE
jgi:hypothetical protein